MEKIDVRRRTIFRGVEERDGVSNRVRQGWAYQFGYIIALIQALVNEYPEAGGA